MYILFIQLVCKVTTHVCTENTLMEEDIHSRVTREHPKVLRNNLLNYWLKLKIKIYHCFPYADAWKLK